MFTPSSRNILSVTLQFGDVNQGEKICLRLRPPHAPDTFLDEEHVVQTMLHEVRSLLCSTSFATVDGSSNSLHTMYTDHTMKNFTTFCPNFKTNMMNTGAQAMLEKDSSRKDNG